MYLIPAPAKLEELSGSFVFSYETYMTVEENCSFRVSKQAGFFNDSVRKILGYGAILVRGCAGKNDLVVRQDNTMAKESYELTISEDGILLKGEESGLWHGLQTLLQIMEQEGAVLPALHIEDAPEMPNRGYYFDCTRGRIPKLEWLKALADRMAYYKMNELQLYIEHTYLFRGMTELWRDDTPLTAEEIMELDHYCVDRGIDLVPSLSSFGHLHKLLSSKEYEHLCELEDSNAQPFSVRARMHHHTITPAKPESLELIKGMIAEYMALFSSKKFNLCADETFDLGQGKSKEMVEKLGKDKVYIGFVKELAEFILSKGKIPMFWGDIIVGFPEMIKELPKEIICLNWGYAWNQSEDSTRLMAQAGATQYCCPGCCSWNEFVALNWCSYNNVKRMCTYAKKYGAIGVLNTDWGDFLHMNHPDFSRTGMIYGAAFSWNSNIPELDDINRQISRLEFHDSSENFLEIVGRIPENECYGWFPACLYMEMKKGISEFMESYVRDLNNELPKLKEVDEKNRKLIALKKELLDQVKYLDSDKRDLVWPYVAAAEGIRIFNEIGKVAAAADFGYEFDTMPDTWQLAKELEIWLYHYKEMYRSVSKQGELHRIEKMVCWYGDYLRDCTKN
ncbi:MAG: family 20 glycosylhydrolase [Lachnospiraceae bacterium]|nr:family 20 glycosylhydrolase [Lachnospiraceae bacterium]